MRPADGGASHRSMAQGSAKRCGQADSLRSEGSCVELGEGRRSGDSNPPGSLNNTPHSRASPQCTPAAGVRRVVRAASFAVEHLRTLQAKATKAFKKDARTTGNAAEKVLG